MFVGRRNELSLLTRRIDHITRTGSGLAVAVRGRRQVGKSRLVQELCDRSGLPYLYFTAVKGASVTEATAQFLADLTASDLPNDHALLPSTPPPGGWGDMLRILAGTLPDQPCIVVLDELPWLAEQDDTFDGQLQVVWDRLLSRRPVLLLLLGSDLHMMQRLTAYDRPVLRSRRQPCPRPAESRRDCGCRRAGGFRRDRRAPDHRWPARDSAALADRNLRRRLPPRRVRRPGIATVRRAGAVAGVGVSQPGRLPARP